MNRYTKFITSYPIGVEVIKQYEQVCWYCDGGYNFFILSETRKNNKGKSKTFIFPKGYWECDNCCSRGKLS